MTSGCSSLDRGGSLRHARSGSAAEWGCGVATTSSATAGWRLAWYGCDKRGMVWDVKELVGIVVNECTFVNIYFRPPGCLSRVLRHANANYHEG